jgi:hypothetical protein
LLAFAAAGDGLGTQTFIERMRERYAERMLEQHCDERAVGLPTGDSKARSIVLGLDRDLVLARRVRDAFAKRSTTSLAAALPEYIRFTMSLNRRVAAYGFKVCGQA